MAKLQVSLLSFLFVWVFVFQGAYMRHYIISLFIDGKGVTIVTSLIRIGLGGVRWHILECRRLISTAHANVNQSRRCQNSDRDGHQRNHGQATSGSAHGGAGARARIGRGLLTRRRLRRPTGGNGGGSGGRGRRLCRGRFRCGRAGRVRYRGFGGAGLA